jgi:hypothetical protein
VDDDGENIVEHLAGAAQTGRSSATRSGPALRNGTVAPVPACFSEERAMRKDDHQKGHSRKNTANIGGVAYAPQQDEPHSKGDEWTPNKPMVAYAKNRDPTRKKKGKC